MIYPLMEPPFRFASFREMSKEQAKEHFDWFISLIPDRVQLLDECFNAVWGCGVRFDYSVESLCPVWAAFEPHIETEEKSDAEIQAELATSPEWLHETLAHKRLKLSLGTTTIAMDMGMYYGEVINRNVPGVHWGYVTRPKSLRSVNRPVLFGFIKRMVLDPRDIVYTGCLRSLRERNPRFLAENLEVWKRFLPPSSE